MEIGEPIGIPLPGLITEEPIRGKKKDWTSSYQAATFVQAAALGKAFCESCAASEDRTSAIGDAQAETFKQAAAQGTPFCETCSG